MMTCREFERRLNELIDAESEIEARALGAGKNGLLPGTSDLEVAIVDHASCCAACQQVAARYQTLRRALAAWNSPPVAPADLAGRILAAAAEVDAPASSAWAVAGEKRKRWRSLLVPWVSVAAACVLALSAYRFLIEVRERPDRAIPRATAVGPAHRVHSVGGPRTGRLADSRVLTVALAEATSATLDLARSASEPAARISRQMLDAATEPESRPGGTDMPKRATDVVAAMPAFKSLAPDPSIAGAMLHEVGGQLALGVSPLSRTARHAFSFLLGPAPAKFDGRNTSPAAKGA
jgi:hypothetical protein